MRIISIALDRSTDLLSSLSCLALPCPALSCPVLSCPVLSCPVLVFGAGALIGSSTKMITHTSTSRFHIPSPKAAPPSGSSWNTA